MNAIGGGTIQGTPMGSRTGYWNPFKTIKKGIDKVLDVGSQIIKSPVGKAAIIGGLGMIPFGASGTSMLGRLGGSGIGQFFKGMGPKLLGTPFTSGAPPGVAGGFTKGLLGKLGLTKGGGSLMPTVFGGITAASQVFPSGLTIYGRWTAFTPSAAGVICYFGK